MIALSRNVCFVMVLPFKLFEETVAHGSSRTAALIRFEFTFCCSSVWYTLELTELAASMLAIIALCRFVLVCAVIDCE